MGMGHHSRFRLAALLAAAILLAPHPAGAAGPGGHEAHGEAPDAVAIQAVLEPLRPGRTAVREGEHARVRITLTDPRSGRPIPDLHPAAWLDGRTAEESTGEETCRRKVYAFMQGSVRSRPEVDLNTYYILTLNREPSISVIDPLLGYGTSKLLALVQLPAAGGDWTQSGDGQRLFVSLPETDQVAVVDLATWTLAATLAAGRRPGRVALHPDGGQLWVGTEGGAESGVTVIRTDTLAVAARIPTGDGRHDVAVGPDGRYVFVTNEDAGTLSVLDARRLTKVRDHPTGPRPAGLAVSAASGLAYVASAGTGAITVVDPDRGDVVATLQAEPGLSTVRLDPAGRWGFAASPTARLVHVFDARAHRLVHSIGIGGRPDGIGVTEGHAYIQAADSEHVTVIPLRALAGTGEIPVIQIPAGQRAPGAATRPGGATMVRAPGHAAMLIANPADQAIYYYMEGMAAPMGSFQTYRREPRAILVADRSLRETAPGTHTATVRLPGSGPFTVGVYLSAPRTLRCFDVTVEADPAKPAASAARLWIEPLAPDRRAPVGEPFRLRFALRDAPGGPGSPDPPDVGVLALGSSGTWQQRARARSVGPGEYEVDLRFPERGAYYLFFEVPSRGVRRNQLRPLIVHAVAPAAGAVGPGVVREGAR